MGDLKKLEKLVDAYMSNKDGNYELECVFRSPITKQIFDRSLQFCRYLPDVLIKPPQISLDVSNKTGIRISITDPEAIATYCKTNIFDKNSIISIQKTRIQNADFENTDIRINLKKEQKIDISEIEGLKHFRYKLRYSFVYKKLQYDLTVVKTSKRDATTVSGSELLQADEKFEIEIEVVDSPTESASFSKRFLQAIMALYGYMNSSIILTEAQQHDIRYSYLSLAYGDGKHLGKDYASIPQKYDPKRVVADSVWRKFAVGPKPVTLEKKNILPVSSDVISIRDNYFATEKADGERMTLYFNTIGKAYLIDFSMKVRFTGATIKDLSNTIIDGEFIVREKACQFAIFDVYVYKNKITSILPFVRLDKVQTKNVENCKSRLEVLNKFMTYADKLDKFLLISLKEFMYGFDNYSIFEASAAIMNKRNKKQYDYEIDGIIYTPLYFPVGGSKIDDKINIRGTWTKCFKWKPINTIDFKVVFDENSAYDMLKDDIVVRLVSVQLYVGTDLITATTFLENTYTNQSRLSEFDPDEVGPVLRVIGNKITCDNEEKTVIPNNSIVEFRYDEIVADKNERWRPLRIREDKHNPNFLTTALSVWKSIQEPVTETMITTTGLSTLEVHSDIYYQRNVQRRDLGSINMNNFHNYIKRDLIKYAASLIDQNDASLMDIACGKGGDLSKWHDAGFKRIFGIDKDRNNIENPEDGIYARIIEDEKRARENKKPVKYAFLTMDASKRIDSTYIAIMQNKADKRVAEVLWGIRNDAQLSHYFEFVKQKFDVISCQFAIHYFFTDKGTLENFVSNVDANLKEGGVFIGTCLDAKEIKKLLKDKTSAEGSNKGKMIWKITKKYPNDDKILFGDEIDVFLESIGHTQTEYLVRFQALQDMLRDKNIVPVEGGKSFDKYSTEYNGAQLSIDEKKYSNLNKTFVFRKVSPSEAAKVDSKKKTTKTTKATKTTAF